MINLKKKLKFSLGLMAVMIFMTASYVTVYALEDGAYTVPVTATYANPETGLIVDGGTNEALGQSMVTSVVSPTALVEVSNGRTFITLGIGLDSNISNTRIQVQNGRGADSYSGVSFTQTGTSTAHDDLVRHLRFEVTDPSVLISPIIFVDPMGRDVQFFVRLNMESATPGTGMFLSEMVTVVEEPVVQETPAETQTDSSTESDSGETETVDSFQEENNVQEDEPEVEPEIERERRIVEIQEVSLEDVVGLTIHEATIEKTEEIEESKCNIIIPIVASIGALCIAGGGFYVFKKKKGAS